MDDKKILDKEIAETDEQLMGRFQEGAEGAFEVLFERYLNHVLNFTYRFLSAREEAEDVTQEVFLRIYKAKERYDVKLAFRPWIFAIAARLASNRKRDKMRHAHDSLDYTNEDSNQNHLNLKDNPALEPEKNVEKSETAERVQKALLLLPENQRTAVLLSRFEEMPYDEIARAMALSVTAVKSLLFRARENLKNQLSD